MSEDPSERVSVGDVAPPPRSASRPLAAAAGAVLVTAAAVWAEGSDLLAARGGLLPNGIGFTRRASGDAMLLALGLLLALSAPRRSGLRIGPVREHWKGVLLVCAIPPLLAALVYHRLPIRPFGGHGVEMWTLSPLAQDLVFAGFLYGWLDRCLPGRLLRDVPLDRALVFGALCFAAWHAQNFLAGVPPAFVFFQLAYTAAGYLLAGLSRQWTGSFLYMTLSHAAVNWIAWRAS